MEKPTPEEVFAEITFLLAKTLYIDKAII